MHQEQLCLVSCMLPETTPCTGNKERLAQAVFIWRQYFHPLVAGANHLQSLLSVSQE